MKTKILIVAILLMTMNVNSIDETCTSDGVIYSNGAEIIFSKQDIKSIDDEANRDIIFPGIIEITGDSSINLLINYPLERDYTLSSPKNLLFAFSNLNGNLDVDITQNIDRVVFANFRQAVEFNPAKAVNRRGIMKIVPFKIYMGFQILSWRFSDGISYKRTSYSGAFAFAGYNRGYSKGDLVQLDGSLSYVKSGSITSFKWSQVSPASPAITLSDPNIPNPTFTAPNSFITLRFRLIIETTYGQSDYSDVEIVIRDRLWSGPRITFSRTAASPSTVKDVLISGLIELTSSSTGDVYNSVTETTASWSSPDQVVFAFSGLNGNGIVSFANCRESIYLPFKYALIDYLEDSPGVTGVMWLKSVDIFVEITIVDWTSTGTVSYSRTTKISEFNYAFPSFTHDKYKVASSSALLNASGSKQVGMTLSWSKIYPTPVTTIASISGNPQLALFLTTAAHGLYTLQLTLSDNTITKTLASDLVVYRQWAGPTLTFTFNGSTADQVLPGYLEIARDAEGLYNKILESSYTGNDSPLTTLWAFSTLNGNGVFTSTFSASTKFGTWKEAVGSSPTNAVNKLGYLYLMQLSIIIPIKFTAWNTSTLAFTYERSTKVALYTYAAALDRKFDIGQTGSLDASLSKSSNNGALTYQWTQFSPSTPVLALSSNTAVNPTFSSPQYPGKFVFQLQVTDTATTPVSVTIKVNVNYKPRTTFYTDRNLFMTDISAGRYLVFDFSQVSLRIFPQGFTFDIPFGSISCSSIEGAKIGVVDKIGPANSQMNGNFFGWGSSTKGPEITIKFNARVKFFGFDYIDADDLNAYGTVFYEDQYKWGSNPVSYSGPGFQGFISGQSDLQEFKFQPSVSTTGIKGFGIDNLVYSFFAVQAIVPEDFTTYEGRTIEIIGNADGGTGDLSYSWRQQFPTSPQVTIITDGTKMYFSHSTDEDITFFFDFTVTDNVTNDSDTAQVKVTVKPILICTEDDTILMQQYSPDRTYYVDALLNDSNSANDPMSVSVEFSTLPAGLIVSVENLLIKVTVPLNFAFPRASFTYNAHASTESKPAKINIVITDFISITTDDDYLAAPNYENHICEAFIAKNYASVFPVTKIKITKLPLNGDMLLNGVPIVLGQEILMSELSGLVFKSNNGFFGYDSFEWQGYSDRWTNTSTVRVSVIRPTCSCS